MKKIKEFINEYLLMLLTLVLFAIGAIVVYSDNEFNRLGALLCFTGLTLPLFAKIILPIKHPTLKAASIATYFIVLVLLIAKSLYWI